MNTGLNDETMDNQIKKIQWAIEFIMDGEPCTCNNPTILCRYCEAVTVMRIIAEQKIKTLKEG